MSKVMMFISGLLTLLFMGVSIQSHARITQLEKQLQTAPTEVRAQAFILVDEFGAKVGSLSIGKDGPALALGDKDGKAIALIESTKVGGRVQLRNADGDPRVSLAVGTAGSSLIFVGSDKKFTATLTDWEGNSKLKLTNPTHYVELFPIEPRR